MQSVVLQALLLVEGSTHPFQGSVIGVKEEYSSSVRRQDASGGVGHTRPTINCLRFIVSGN